jgi:hypothetical protein
MTEPTKPHASPAPVAASPPSEQLRPQVEPHRDPWPALVLVAAGIAAAVVGVVIEPARTWQNLLVDAFYALTLGVAALFFFATQRLASARWSAPLRRIAEALMLTLPAAAVLLLLLGFGFPTLYTWMHPQQASHAAGHAAHAVQASHAAHAAVDAGRTTYLAPGFVIARMVGVVLLWGYFALRIRAVSRAGDADRAAGLRAHARLGRLAAVFTPIFAFTFSLAAYDWIISLDPEWFSTMFAVYVFAGAFAQGLAAITLATALLHRRGDFARAGGKLRADQLHDLGKMLFAFCTFWAYIWVCQYLLIWYGNLPEEVTYYLRRTSEAWLPLFLVNFAINWAIPFFALLPVAAKRDPRRLAAVGGLVLFGHWLDLYLMVVPSRQAAPSFGVLELAMAAGTGALLYLLFLRGLRRAPLLPLHDPVLAAARPPAAAPAAPAPRGDAR